MNAKIFKYKILVFTILVLILQWYICVIFPPELPKPVTMIKEAVKKNPQVIALGDSTVVLTSPADKDMRSTFEMLAELLPQYSIEGVSKHSNHLELYLNFCKYIASMPNTPKLIIIPINLRSFSPHWDLRGCYEAKDEKYALTYNNDLFYMMYRPLAIFKMFEPDMDDYDYYRSPVYNGDDMIGQIRDFYMFKTEDMHTDKYRRDRFMFHYMYKLSPQQSKFLAISEIHRICEAKNIKVLFYVTPIDYEMGEKYVKGEFVSRLKDNVSMIKRLATKENIDLLDLTFSLGADGFFWQLAYFDSYFPSEHLNAQGRLLVAQQLAEKVTELMEQ